MGDLLADYKMAHNQITAVTSQTAKGVYIHIPYCLKKCTYCDFSSGPLQSPQQLKQYGLILLEEIRNRAHGFAKTVYFGGGTPSLAEPEQICLLLECLSQHMTMSSQAEISMEVNPGTTTQAKLSQLIAAGINRLSIGVQSTSEKLLRILGRCHTAIQAQKTMEEARKSGFYNISCDLIYAIPTQTFKDFQHDLETLLTWGPDHISLYALSVEPNTPLARQIYAHAIPAPDDDVAAEMYEWAREFLFKNGFFQYELSNFSKPGFECQHNILYWQNKEYLGLGASAHTYEQGIRSWNVKDPDIYMERIVQERSAQAGSESLQGRVRIAEHLIMGLRMTQGVKKHEIQEAFGKDWDCSFISSFNKMIQAGLLIDDKDTLKLSPQGMLLANIVFREIL